MRMPAIGFGCSPVRPGGERVEVADAVRAALAAGYRLFDCAEAYGNERAVGAALRRRPAPPRHELFLVGKVWRTNFRPPALRGACEDSLRRLGVEAFDLYLLHALEAWRHVAPLEDPEAVGEAEFERRLVPRDPRGEVETEAVPLAETWGAMQDLVRLGLAAEVGVSNFGPAAIEALGMPPPAVNQIAHSPYSPEPATTGWCRARGVRLMAHSPLSPPGLLGEPLLAALAQRLRCSPAQVVLRWNVDKGVVPLPASVDSAHIAENLAALALELDAEALAALDSLAGQGPATRLEAW